METTATIGTEVHQRIQGAGTAADAQHLIVAFGIARGQGVLMHQPDDTRTFAILAGLHRDIVFHIDHEAASSKAANYRVTIAIGCNQ